MQQQQGPPGSNSLPKTPTTAHPTQQSPKASQPEAKPKAKPSQPRLKTPPKPKPPQPPSPQSDSDEDGHYPPPEPDHTELWQFPRNNAGRGSPGGSTLQPPPPQTPATDHAEETMAAAAEQPSTILAGIQTAVRRALQLLQSTGGGHQETAAHLQTMLATLQQLSSPALPSQSTPNPSTQLPTPLRLEPNQNRAVEGPMPLTSASSSSNQPQQPVSADTVGGDHPLPPAKRLRRCTGIIRKIIRLSQSIASPMPGQRMLR